MDKRVLAAVLCSAGGAVVMAFGPGAYPEYAQLLTLAGLAAVGAGGALYFVTWLVSLRKQHAELVEPNIQSGGQLDALTLEATGIVHGGQLRLEVARNEEQRFVDMPRLLKNEVEMGLLVSLINGDYKHTVDDVVVKILSYKRMLPNPLTIAVSSEIDPAARDARRRALHPSERREYVLGVLEERLDDPSVRVFWLGGKSAGEPLEFGTYEVRVGFSGRNISQKVETLELRFAESSIGLSGVRQHAD